MKVLALNFRCYEEVQVFRTSDNFWEVGWVDLQTRNLYRLELISRYEDMASDQFYMIHTLHILLGAGSEGTQCHLSDFNSFHFVLVFQFHFITYHNPLDFRHPFATALHSSFLHVAPS